MAREKVLGCLELKPTITCLSFFTTEFRNREGLRNRNSEIIKPELVLIIGADSGLSVFSKAVVTEMFLTPAEIE